MTIPFSLVALAAIVLVAIAALFSWRRDSRKIGQLQEKADVSHGTIQELDKANAARDRLRSDPDYARRVRERFTRPE